MSWLNWYQHSKVPTRIYFNFSRNPKMNSCCKNNTPNLGCYIYLLSPKQHSSRKLPNQVTLTIILTLALIKCHLSNPQAVKRVYFYSISICHLVRLQLDVSNYISLTPTNSADHLRTSGLKMNILVSSLHILDTRKPRPKANYILSNSTTESRIRIKFSDSQHQTFPIYLWSSLENKITKLI